jgi:hypothetical protein
MNDTCANLADLLPVFLSTSYDCVAIRSIFGSFELSIPFHFAHYFLVSPLPSIYRLIPTNEFETKNARDAHEIEVFEVSEN